MDPRHALRQAIELALAHHRSGRFAEAEAAYRQVLRQDPQLAEARANLAHTLEQQARIEEAIAGYREALALRPDSAEILNNLGNVLSRIGELDEAIACYRKSIALQPGYPAIHDALLCSLLYCDSSTPDDIFSAHLRYAAQFEAPLKSTWPAHANRRDPDRRLRVGYVSADLYNHSVAYFIEPILAHHDRSQIESFAYYNGAREDAVTARIKSAVDHWTPCAQLPDEQLAARIQADGIDVLVDLAGHTAGNRMLTFARKPAPIQVTYLGYPTTTGLSAMDYRLTSGDVDPEPVDLGSDPTFVTSNRNDVTNVGSDPAERFHSERLYRLPRTLWCYRPASDMPAAVGPAPALAKGYVTFGSMNNFSKVSPRTLALWCDILRGVPDSRLVTTNLPGEFAVTALHARFAAHGISPDRLTLYTRLAADRFRALANDIDIALDPFPYNGTTTTCEALWMGIPVVTLIGQTSAARSGYALLKSAGLNELCAGDEAAYVKIAVALAADPRRLDNLRRTMRARIAASPLRDEAAMARDVEQAYRTMWQSWCRS